MSSPNKYNPSTNTPILEQARGLVPSAERASIVEPVPVKQETNAQPVLVINS